MSGVEADLARMQATASEAARIGDELRAAVTRLDAALSGLGAMDGQIRNPFWQGHRNHLDAVTKLCTKLHQMSEGITTSQKLYAAQDGESHAAFTQISGGAIDVGKL